MHPTPAPVSAHSPCLRSRKGGAPRAWPRAPDAIPPLEGADPAPRWTLRRLVGWVRERFGLVCCRETIRAVLHRLKLSWKKAKKLLGRADPERRQAFLEQLQGVLAGAQRDQHLVVFLDEAHIHQDADLGYGWAKRGERFLVASRSPGLSARVSLLWALSLQRRPGAAVALSARQRRTHDRC